MNMNKFYGGWSPMGQAFKSMQNQRGFEYRKSDAIELKSEIFDFSYYKKIFWE